MRKLLLLLPAVFLVVACTSQSVDKGVAPQNNIPVPTKSFAEGKTLFENSCGKCHTLPTVTKYDDEKWKNLVAWMAPEAKLNTQQSELIYEYLSNTN